MLFDTRLRRLILKRARHGDESVRWRTRECSIHHDNRETAFSDSPRLRRAFIKQHGDCVDQSGYGQKAERVHGVTEKEIEERLKWAEAAFAHHRRQPFAKRAQFMMPSPRSSKQEKKELAQTITLEMGKLLGGASGKSRNARAVADFTPRTQSDFLKTNRCKPTRRRSFVRYEPLGPCLQSCRGIFHSGRCSVSRCRR